MKKVLVGMVALLLSTVAFAHETSTNIDIELTEFGWDAQGGNAVLLIETTDTALDQALSDLGVGYDMFSGSDFSGLDLSGYTQVFLAMDGGLVEAPSIANIADFVNGGGCLHIYGGTCYQPYAIALNTYLLQNNTGDYCWTTVGGFPHSQVTDAGHYLAQSLPGEYNFVDIAATYYQTRSTDAATDVAAVNGDGYDHLMSKTIGSGNFDICINSPFYAYYFNQSDYDWLKQVVDNMLKCGSGPIATESTTWGQIKARHQ